MTHSNQASPITVIRNEELLKKAPSHIYKHTNEAPLSVHCFHPENHTQEDHRSAIVFFHGGKWDNPQITQFIPQALNFAALGMVAVIAQYRTSKTHQTDAYAAITDAQNALLWIKQNNRQLGVDPQKVVAAGAGSGAHIALCSAMLKKVTCDESYSSRPNALLLWSAIIDTTKKSTGHHAFTHAKDAKKTSPTKNIRRKLPPMIFFHGKEDPVSPIQHIEAFCNKLTKKKNTALFVPFSHATHTFFNFNVNQDYFVHTLECAETFLIHQKLLPQKPIEAL